MILAIGAFFRGEFISVTRLAGLRPDIMCGRGNFNFSRFVFFAGERPQRADERHERPTIYRLVRIAQAAIPVSGTPFSMM